MRPGQQANFGNNRANCRQIAAVDALAGLDDVAANNFRLKLFKQTFGSDFRLFLVETFLDGLTSGGDGCSTFLLVGDRECSAHCVFAEAFDFGVKLRVIRRLKRERLFRALLSHVDDHVDHGLHLRVAKSDCAQHFSFAQLRRF